MRRLAELEVEEKSITTLTELTNVFEGLASVRITQIKDQVVQSSKFYHQLWSIYSQIKVEDIFSFGREGKETEIIDKELYILITAEGSFSGDIDQKLVQLMVKDYDKNKNDIIVIGHHGAMQLAVAGVNYIKYFKMPSRDNDINVKPIINEVKKYKSTRIYYQNYVSLFIQDVKRIDLSKAVNERGEFIHGAEDQLINEKTYIFEPSTYSLVAHLERSMMQITVTQLILESKLAQYASRFQAMKTAHTRADEVRSSLHIENNQVRRAIKDERLREITSGLKQAKSKALI
jgi:ATP synthase F1 gamma subunit